MKLFYCVLPVLLMGSAAQAAEVFGGAFVHDVHTPLTKSGQERGVDLQLGWRGGGISGLKAIGAPSQHIYVSANTAGDTHFAAAGISWKIGRRIYVRPGIGLAVHDGPRRGRASPERIDFGSRILFAPELGVGFQAGRRLSIEASWVHLSHALIFSSQNPGMDSFGLRLNYRY